MMARISTGSRPDCQRNSRSFRQWPSLLTSSTVLTGSAARCRLPPILWGAGKPHAHEEQARGVVVVLRGFFDVAAMFEQKARDGVHQPQTVGAGQGQDIG